jgi:anti-sigma regulatory factor (Ser/Thr protein kinase)
MARLNCLEDIRGNLRKLLEFYTVDEFDIRRRDLSVLAVSEAATNVIQHGLFQDPEKEFVLELEARDTWYAVTFRYEGVDFDWARDRKPSILAMDESGYGLYIMKNAMYSVVHARSDTGAIEITLSDVVGC